MIIWHNTFVPFFPFFVAINILLMHIFMSLSYCHLNSAFRHLASFFELYTMELRFSLIYIRYLLYNIVRTYIGRGFAYEFQYIV